MDYSYYTQQIYQWLTNSGLSGSTTQLLSAMTELNTTLIQLGDKIDGLALQLQELLSYADRGIYLVSFFGCLWFGMQFVQKRWYTE